MRRLTSILTIVAASVLLTGSTLTAAEEEIGATEGKDECLLVALNCEQSVDSIQMRIERLNREIAKGTDVYTADELNILKEKLDDVYKELDTLTTGG